MLIKKRQLVAAILIFSLASTAYATAEGYYFGLNVGQTNVHAKTQTFITDVPPGFITVAPTNTGIGERLFMGYDINQYAAIEGGFAHYGSATYNIPASSMVSCNNPSIRQNSFDLEGKGMLPFSTSGFDVFIKAGMAAVYAGSSGSLQSSSSASSPCSSNSSKAAVRPLFGVGAEYDITPSWVAEISYTQYNGGGNVQTASLLSVGISYHIVDKYCGQFLC